MPSSSREHRGVQPVQAMLLTPPGRGALAVVGVVGEAAVAVVDTLFAARGLPLARRPDDAIAFGRWRSTGEEVVAVRLAASRLEIHCHGGQAASAAVIEGLLAAGATLGTWQEWLDGGLESGPCGREALALLPAAAGPRPAMILARQAAGLLDAELARLAVLPHPEATHAAKRLLAAARVGLRLTRPWRVVLAGSVNAGKSSLMNALAGHARSIVSPLPGTTRDVVVAPVVLDGWGVELVDVAGSREAASVAGASEREGIARAAAARETADLVLRVEPADGSEPAEAAAHELIVRSKSDLASAAAAAGAIATSAMTGAGIGDLIAAVVARLVPEAQADPTLLAGAVPFTPRQVEAIETLVRNPSSRERW